MTENCSILSNIIRCNCSTAFISVQLRLLSAAHMQRKQAQPEDKIFDSENAQSNEVQTEVTAFMWIKKKKLWTPNRDEKNKPKENKFSQKISFRETWKCTSEEMKKWKECAFIK